MSKACHRIGEDRSNMEATTHHRRAEIATEKRSPFRPHRGLAAPDLFLDTMLSRRTWKACPIDCTKVHVPEHEVTCRSEPTGEKRGEGETATGQQPPRASGCKAATSSRG
jgi:hypothetical protein